MELEHSFTVPVPEDRAWEVLLDVERVAPCMPGATLQSIDGDVIHGSIKVKVGPISMTYQGTARFTERDPDRHVVTLEASGRDTRGAGTASATVRSTLEGNGDETHVIVHTSLNVTGKPAQFGRGVLAEVGGKLIGIFADNLAAMLAAQSEPGGGAAADGTPARPETASGHEQAERASEPQAAAAANSAAAAEDEALPIDVLNLGGRAWSSLRQAGIQTLGDLVKRTAQQLLAIDNIGPASVADIRHKLADRGLALAGSSAGANGVSAAASDAAVAAQPREHGTAAASGGVATSAGRASGSDANGARAGRPEQESSSAAPRVTALRPAPDWQPEDDAIDLLSVAGLPVLKRALPAVAAAIGLILVVVGLRRRRSRRR